MVCRGARLVIWQARASRRSGPAAVVGMVDFKVRHGIASNQHALEAASSQHSSAHAPSKSTLCSNHLLHTRAVLTTGKQNKRGAATHQASPRCAAPARPLVAEHPLAAPAAYPCMGRNQQICESYGQLQCMQRTQDAPHGQYYWRFDCTALQAQKRCCSVK